MVVAPVVLVIKFLDRVHSGLVWAMTKRYRGQVVRGMEGEVLKAEWIAHMDRVIEAQAVPPLLPEDEDYQWREWYMENEEGRDDR